MHLSTFFFTLAVVASPATAQITSFCTAASNSTGSATLLQGSLGPGPGAGLHLTANQGVPGEFGYVLVGDEPTAPLAVSQGLLCLGTAQGSAIYRYNQWGTQWASLGRFDSQGVLANLSGTAQSGLGFDVPSLLPSPNSAPILVGETWHFQLWHRDSLAGPGASNFSNGLSVVFQAPVVPIAGMVPVAAGTFQMGSSANALAPYFEYGAAKPVHAVTISYDFWIAAKEVTQQEFQNLFGYNPSTYVGPNRPVDTVWWGDARLYCQFLTDQERMNGNLPDGWQYRLPTEAEWEMACRAGGVEEFSNGASLTCAQSRMRFSEHGSMDCASIGSVDVGTFAPNALGLYDMHGNVFEWCLDSWRVYTSQPQTDPFTSASALRIVRGGSWISSSSECRSAYRIAVSEVNALPSVGFRVVLGPELNP